MPIKSISDAVDAAKAQIENLSIDEQQAEMASNPDLQVVDIREIQERVDSGTIPGSVHAPRAILESWVDSSSP